MSAAALAPLAYAAAYFIGAIPFGYLVFYAVKRTDIRTVGSGNIGATNVGRQLGFRYFVFVFVLDLLKGFLPTWYFPRLMLAWTGTAVPAAGVLVALAAILGHNFPIYLRFQGGKGVATSLGALLALDPAASLASVAGFVLTLGLSRYVSLSSILGGIAFVAVHFARTAHPWGRDHMGMSVFTLALLGLLIVRHRKNLERLRAGTEPQVGRGRKPSGRISGRLLGLIAVAGSLAVGLARVASLRPEVTAGPFHLAETDQVGTGHQRVERVAFLDAGRRLVATCPRYDRVVLYRVAPAATLVLERDIALAGRPVAVCDGGDRFLVLERPSGDARHVEPGWWETFDLDGNRVGDRRRAGFYPDDMAVTPDGSRAVILCSGRGEGGPHRPPPALEIVALDAGPGRDGLVGRLTFDDPKDDPARLTLSRSGRFAVVTLRGVNQSAAVDLTDPAHPRLLGRSPLPEGEAPYLSRSGPDDDLILMPVATPAEALAITGPDGVAYLARTLPHGSGLRLAHLATGRPLGDLPLRGSWKLTSTRPTALAYCPERRLMAVANRSGGIHLVSLHERPALLR